MFNKDQEREKAIALVAKILWEISDYKEGNDLSNWINAERIVNTVEWYLRDSDSYYHMWRTIANGMALNGCILCGEQSCSCRCIYCTWKGDGSYKRCIEGRIDHDFDSISNDICDGYSSYETQPLPKEEKAQWYSENYTEDGIYKDVF